MKKTITFFIPCLLFFICSCKKNSNDVVIPPGNPDYEVKASVAKGMGTATPFISNGNSTLFARSVYPNGDTVIVILGSVGDHQLKITLVNIGSAGIYEFETDTGSRQDLFCDYIIGNPYSPSEFYSTQSSDMPGNITIESITASAIKGTFNADCSNGAVKITNRSFKGGF